MDVTLIAELVRGWFAGAYGLTATVDEVTEVAPRRFSVLMTAGGQSVAIEGGVLFGDLLEPPFEARTRMFEREVGKGLKGGYLLWPPPSAQIPTETADLQYLVTAIRDNAKEMTAGEVRDVPIPVTLALRKTAPEGQYITVTGGLSSHWSQMSRYIRGVYQLDSRAIHRLPRDEEFVPELSRRLAEVSTPMQVGEWVEVPSADHWTLQRLDRGQGFAVVMAPPEFDPGDGTFVRRALKRLVRELGARLAERTAALRVLLLVSSHYSIREENIGPALVGFDPAMYVAIDLFCLVADGEMKAILEPPSGAVPWLTRV